MKTKGISLFFLLSLVCFCAPAFSVWAQTSPSANAAEELVKARKQIDYLQSARNYVRQYQGVNSNEDVNDLIQKIDVALKRVERDATVDPMVSKNINAALDHDADWTQNFILVLAPIFCGIVFVMAFSTNRPKKINPSYQTASQNLRLAVIDFDVSDEELLELRKKLASIPRVLG